MDRLKEIEDEIELAHRAIEDAQDRLEELEVERDALLGRKPAGPDLTIKTVDGLTLGLTFSGNEEERAALARLYGADIIRGGGVYITFNGPTASGEGKGAFDSGDSMDVISLPATAGNQGGGG